MTLDKAVKVVTVCQIQEALEERQTSDRRKAQKGIPENVNQERRKADRRNKGPSDIQ